MNVFYQVEMMTLLKFYFVFLLFKFCNLLFHMNIRMNAFPKSEILLKRFLLAY